VKPGETQPGFKSLTLRHAGKEDTMATVDQEMMDRDRLATSLVEHLRSRETTRAEIPITRVDAAGRLSLWKVTVERVGKLDFRAG
jgi:hypothetical protein